MHFELKPSQTGLFSADLATFIIGGLSNLQRDPGTSSVDLLSQISQQLAAFKRTVALSVIVSLLCVRVLFWLVFSNSGPVAIFLSPKITAASSTVVRGSDLFFAEGVTKQHLPWVVKALLALVRIFAFFFFSGLLVYTYDIHRTLFFLIFPPILFCGFAYSELKLMPILHHSSPYRAPLSS